MGEHLDAIMGHSSPLRCLSQPGCDRPGSPSRPYGVNGLRPGPVRYTGVQSNDDQHMVCDDESVPSTPLCCVGDCLGDNLLPFGDRLLVIDHLRHPLGADLGVSGNKIGVEPFSFSLESEITDQSALKRKQGQRVPQP
jgi:hypothetical protein